MFSFSPFVPSVTNLMLFLVSPTLYVIRGTCCLKSTVKGRLVINFYVCLFHSYAELIADWPVVVLGVCTVLIVICALVGILVPDLPDFSDPLLVSTLLIGHLCR